MIPLYIGPTDRGASGLPTKNPIYFIRKSVGSAPTTKYDIIVLNSNADMELAPAVSVLTTAGYDHTLDVEMMSAKGLYDLQVEPNPDKDGSLAGLPKHVQTAITISGFIRNDRLKDIQLRNSSVKYLTSDSESNDNPISRVENFTVAEPGTFLLAFVGTDSGVVTSVKWFQSITGGVGLDPSPEDFTLISRQTGGSDHDIEAWGLRDPDLSTDTDSEVQAAHPDGRNTIAVFSFRGTQGADVASAVRTTDSVTGTSLTPSLTVNGLEPGDTAIACLSYHDGGVGDPAPNTLISPGNGWTERVPVTFHASTHSAGIYAMQKKVGPGESSVTASLTMTKLDSSTNPWSLMVVVLKGLEGGIQTASTSFEEIQRFISHISYSFDPGINYLEGASTFMDTVVPTFQTFHNAQAGILAWYDDSADGDWRTVSTLQNNGVDAFDVEEFARLNRFMYVQAVEGPTLDESKFRDMQVPFTMRFIAADPHIYEFIVPTTWYADGQTSQLFIDSANNEDYVVPSTLWFHDGPGWREVSDQIIRLYHTSSGDPLGLGGPADTATGWTAPGSGISGVAYKLLKIAPANSIGGTDNWDAVNAPVSFRFQFGYTVQLNVNARLLGKIQQGFDLRGQNKANSRSGIGINEGAQDNYFAIALRLYRPGTGFIHTFLAPTQVGFTKFPAQSTRINRTWNANNVAGYSDAQSTDHLVFDYGLYHVGPTGGGTGGGVLPQDQGGANDLPIDETTTSAYNSWIDVL